MITSPHPARMPMMASRQRDWRALGHWLVVWLAVGIASLAVGGLLPGPR